MAIIGSMAVNIVAKTDEFIRGINNAQKQLKKFVNFSGWLRTAATGFLGQQIMGAVDAASELVDMSTATGVAVDQLDFLRYAAKQTGADLGNVMKGMKELIGKGISPDRLEEIAIRLNKIADPTQRARKAMELLGKKSALSLLPMLRDLPALRKRFAELGGGISTAVANRMDAIGDSMEDVRLAMRNVYIQIADALGPSILRITKDIGNLSSGVGAWAKQHPTLVDWIGKATIAVGLMAPACWALNEALTAIKGTLIAINAIAKSGIIAKLLTALIGTPAGLAALAVLAGGVTAGVGYQLYKESSLTPKGTSGEWESESITTAKEHVKEQRRTNDILSQMVRGGSRVPSAVLIAGGRE